MGPRIQAEKKNKKHPRNKKLQHETKRFFLQKGAFSGKKEKLFFLMALGCWPFCRQKPVMTTTKNTIKQGVLLFFLVVFYWSLLPHNKNKTTKTNNKSTKQQQQQQQTTPWSPESLDWHWRCHHRHLSHWFQSPGSAGLTVEVEVALLPYVCLCLDHLELELVAVVQRNGVQQGEAIGQCHKHRQKRAPIFVLLVVGQVLTTTSRLCSPLDMQ